jgi:ribosome assembly protein RRB1
MLHRANTEWPCLSCDFISGNTGYNFEQNLIPEKNPSYPLEVYSVAGSQASVPKNNRLYVMRMANLHETMHDDDPEEVGDETEFNEGNPVIIHRAVPIKGGVNRIRSMQGSPLVAMQSEARKVKIFDLAGLVQDLKNCNIREKIQRKGKEVDLEPLATFSSVHEGYALEWSPLQQGLLASGNCGGILNIYCPADEGMTSFKKLSEFNFHGDSLEDIQFSPNDKNGIATCGCDGFLNFVDLRKDQKSALVQTMQVSQDCDANVIAWNKMKPTLIAVGLDDGSFKVFDIRYPKEDPITFIKWHEGPITSLSWQPDDQWTLAVSSDDNRLSVWDFSVEDGDAPPQMDQEGEEQIPDQMIFLHQGQDYIKELRWSPYLSNTIMTTALNGFNVFQPGVDQTGSALGYGEENDGLDIIPEQVNDGEF